MKKPVLIFMFLIFGLLLTGCRKGNTPTTPVIPSTPSDEWIVLTLNNYEEYLDVAKISKKTDRGATGTAFQFSSVASYLFFSELVIEYTYTDFSEGNGSTGSPFGSPVTTTTTIKLNSVGGGTTKASSSVYQLKIISVNGKVKTV